MGRLIDADAAYAVLTNYYHHTTDTQHAALREALGQVESVDAVPVVRCKDCRYWNKYPGSSAAPQYHECMVRISQLGNLYTTAGEYCSRGERKDGEGNG
jgi:hypothetical protein